MNNKISVTEKYINIYKEKYLENYKRINYDEVTSDYKAKTYFYDELNNVELDGYPFASDLVDSDGNVYSMNNIDDLSDKEKKKCRLRYHFLPNTHELYVGTTGSGKTTGCVEPQLRAISALKNKPNIFLTDPKGELYERNIKHLVDNGYKVFVLNFKDYERSDRWNPLLNLYDLKMELKSCGEGIDIQSGKVKPDFEKISSEPFTNVYYTYKGRAFQNEELLNGFIELEKEMIEAELSSEINQLVNMMIKVTSKNDKTWEMGAQDLLRGLLYVMLEEAALPNTAFTREMFTLYNVKKFYLYLRHQILNEGNKLHNLKFIKNKPEYIISYMATALDNAGNTMRSYCGVFDSSIQMWFQGHIFTLTTGNTIDLDTVGDKPFAIFLITRDYEKSDFAVAGLFVDWVYKQMIKKFEAGEKTRTLHFILDEFGNIPEIVDFGNKISTSRSRNIWFHLVVQSYKQIDEIYNPDKAYVIRDNCNAQIFLGAQNIDTKQIFSEQCGKHMIPSIDSYLKSSVNQLVEVPLLPTSSLDLIKPGQIYIKRIYMPLILSQYIRSYICANLNIFDGFYGGKENVYKYAPYAYDNMLTQKRDYDLNKIYPDSSTYW